MNDKATPRPWRRVRDAIYAKGNADLPLVDTEGHYAATEADLDLIVRAVNSYDAVKRLVLASRRLLIYLENHDILATDSIGMDDLSSLKLALEALAKLDRGD